MGHTLFAVIDKWTVIGLVFEFTPLVRLAVVHQFPGTGRIVAVEPEIIHERTGIFQHGIIEPFIPEKIAGGMTVDTGQEAGTGRRTDRMVAVSASERHPRFRQLFHIWCNRLWMSFLSGYASDVIV